jgi:hypothetical protein
LTECVHPDGSKAIFFFAVTSVFNRDSELILESRDCIGKADAMFTQICLLLLAISLVIHVVIVCTFVHKRKVAERTCPWKAVKFAAKIPSTAPRPLCSGRAAQSKGMNLAEGNA